VSRLAVILGLWLGSALRGARSSPLPTAVAVATIALALVLVGAFALLVANMEGLLARFSEELHVVAYLDAGLPAAEQRSLAERAETIEGVASVVLVTPEEALERFRTSLGGSDLVEGLEENPLPSSLEIELAAASRTEQGVRIVASALDGLPGIDELAHGQRWVESYARAASLVRSAAVVLGGVLVIAALLIVANRIRLAVYTREGLPEDGAAARATD